MIQKSRKKILSKYIINSIIFILYIFGVYYIFRFVRDLYLKNDNNRRDNTQGNGYGNSYSSFNGYMNDNSNNNINNDTRSTSDSFEGNRID